jgi:cytoskeletal protein CcmA (bactofilin family)
MTTTLIAKRTRVGGLIETEGDVMVEGRVEGTIRAGGCVTVGVSGVAVSDVVASRALVLGILIGNVTATERIDVAGSARVVGDVRAPIVSVASSGLVEGRIEELDPNEDAETGESKPTLRLRGDPLVRPARPPSAPVPPVVAARSPSPARSTSPARPGAPPSPRGIADPTSTSMRATRDTPPPPPPRAARDSSPMRASVPPRRDGDSRSPVREPTPTSELPTSPPRPQRHAAPTQPAEPAPPTIPRPPGRVRLVPRGTSGNPR